MDSGTYGEAGDPDGTLSMDTGETVLSFSNNNFNNPVGNLSSDSKLSTTQKSENTPQKHYDLNTRYRFGDGGPFIVYIESVDNNIGKLHPIRVGHYLHLVQSIKNSIVSIKSVGRNKIKVEFNNINAANTLINHECVKANNFIAYIPKFYVERKGILRSVDTMFDNDYILNKIESDNPNIKVSEVKRFMRKIATENGDFKSVPRQLVCVSFLGTNLPKQVVINSCIFSVEPYIYPVIQCYTCLRYGHMSQQCKGKARCRDCGESHEGECPIITKCVHCGDDHPAISKNCPEYKKQRQIKEIMAMKNISFKEAEKLYSNPNYYSNILSNNRFAALANDMENFPPLQPIITNTNTNTFISKPKVIRRNSVSSNNSESIKKRKITSNDSCTTQIISKAKMSSSVLPNPHRDDFIAYKEKIIDGIFNMVNSLLENHSGQKDDIVSGNFSDIKKSISDLIENLVSSNG